MESHASLQDLKGVGPALAGLLGQIGLRTVDDLAEYFPRRYEDYSQVTPIDQLQPGQVTLRARIENVSGRYVRRGMHITEATAVDDSGSVRLTWFNQPYRAAAIKPDTEYYISGDFALRNQRLSIASPRLELVSDFPLSTARIVPVYRETKGLKSAQIRKLLGQILPYIRQLPETLPPWLLADAKLMSRAKAYETIHFPDDAETLAAARRRLGFEEVFSLSLAALMNKAEIAHEHALAIDFDEQLAKDFVKHLPFRLTNPQRRAIWQIYLDMQRTQPMNRLVEGDVGSGKTVVAAMAALMVMHSGRQVVMMAPTELLARQHYQSLTRLLAALGLEEQVGLLIGGLSKRAKTTIRQQIADGTVRFVVGTHALLQDTVDVHNLGLVIVDEQHRFGVDQRTALQAKAGHAVHVLNTTATPIPRSLALTLYGELDISIIDAKPQGRAPIITTIVSPNSRQQLHDDLRQQLADGRQVFVVCALIQDSSAIKSRSAEQVYREMQREFADYRVGLLHGKLRSDEKDAVMQAFVRHEVDILVSTTVIEVGVDVPNASVMVIEGAERFGLAQAHQLRGRVGRGEHQGYCYLVLSDSAPPSKRIRALQTSHDGFRLAELDLEIRGPGAIYGTMQHGALDLRIASLGDTRLIAAARSAAEQFLARQDNLLHYEQLSARVQRLRAVTNLN